MPKRPLPALPGFKTLVDARGFSLLAHCRRCKNRTVLDVEAFAAKYGWDYPAPLLEARLVCAQCRANDASLTYAMKLDARELKRMERDKRG